MGCSNGDTDSKGDQEQRKTTFEKLRQHAKEFVEATPEEHKQWLKNTFSKVWLRAMYLYLSGCVFVCLLVRRCSERFLLVWDEILLIDIVSVEERPSGCCFFREISFIWFWSCDSDWFYAASNKQYAWVKQVVFGCELIAPVWEYFFFGGLWWWWVVARNAIVLASTNIILLPLYMIAVYGNVDKKNRTEEGGSQRGTCEGCAGSFCSARCSTVIGKKICGGGD